MNFCFKISQKNTFSLTNHNKYRRYPHVQLDKNQPWEKQLRDGVID